ncbi:cupin-like domain-containing protein [Oscillatoria sp. CS-180]|uniref:cupin-like domain-containing protein n=1 Tax=Oscillatoria sp. CS-180 TaxID=3021720 RepID=UPI00232D1FBD|nr:cupin-like domain-containing protein [Oscillatoria sp. CS-180]MDB9527431.1 cupin-like domain-containing protein [Oscillatoria sp. CS-180]
MQRLIGFLGTIILVIFSTVLWFLWCVASAVNFPPLKRKQTQVRSDADSIAADDIYSALSPQRPKRVTGFAETCPALEWTETTISALVNERVAITHPKDAKANAMFPISPAWRTKLVTIQNIPWQEAVQRVFTPPIDAPPARFIYRSKVTSKNDTGPTEKPLWRDLPAKPAAWYRSIWFQSRGAVTPFHYDTRHATLTVLYGCKRFILYPPLQGLSELSPFKVGSMKGCFASSIGFHAQDDPRELRFLSTESPAPYEIVLQPGETLYIPPYWWHHVNCLENSITLQHFRPLRLFERAHPLMARVFIDLIMINLASLSRFLWQRILLKKDY